MSRLDFSRIEGPVEADFSCANHSIDEMIKNSFYLDKLRRCYTFKIAHKSKVVGYYMIGLKRFSLSELEPPLDDYSIGRYDDIYAVHIQYIAINEKYQHKGIGTRTLRFIMEDVHAMSSYFPIRMLTLNALNELVEWYQSLGFKTIDVDVQNSETILMYRDFLSDDELKELEKLTELES